jgi:hypothetical protein
MGEGLDRQCPSPSKTERASNNWVRRAFAFKLRASAFPTHSTFRRSNGYLSERTKRERETNLPKPNKRRQRRGRPPRPSARLSRLRNRRASRIRRYLLPGLPTLSRSLRLSSGSSRFSISPGRRRLPTFNSFCRLCGVLRARNSPASRRRSASASSISQSEATAGLPMPKTSKRKGHATMGPSSVAREGR